MADTIPVMFYYEGALHRKRRIVKSSSAVVAWRYREQEYTWLPLLSVRKYHQKAYTVAQAAALINISSTKVRDLIKKGKVKMPERAYNFLDGSYRPQSFYISQEDMLDLRQAAWDVLSKNKFGEPYNDTMVSEAELDHRMKRGDDREFTVRENGEVIKIYQA